MGVVGGLDALMKRASAQDVAPDDRDQHRVLEVVVERVAPGDALDGAPRERAELLGGLVKRRAEDLPEILRQKFC